MPSYDLGRAHGRIQLAGPPEVRCIYCYCPSADHIAPSVYLRYLIGRAIWRTRPRLPPFRYVLRVWVFHLLPARICRCFRPLRRTKGH